MHLVAAPFIIGGLVLKIYNNKKKRLVPLEKETTNDDRQSQQDRIYQKSTELS